MKKRRYEEEQINESQSPTKRSRSSKKSRQLRQTEPANQDGNKRLASLHDLPVELLYEILLFSVNPSFTILSRHIHSAFQSTGPHFRADYLVQATESLEDRETFSPKLWWKQKFDIWLRYGICDFEVLQLAISQTHPPTAKPSFACQATPDDAIELPKRILRSFRSSQSADQESRWTREAAAIGFLRYLLNPIVLPVRLPVQRFGSSQRNNVTISGNPNSHEGYFLARAVHLNHEPLLDLLLAYEADPLQKDGIAIKLAIKKKDEQLVRKLLSKSRLERLHFTNVGRNLLAYAVRTDARDIANYFIKEQRIVPDLETLRLLI